ncbi:MAG: inorganic diphosphatase [Salinibacter sp.]
MRLHALRSVVRAQFSWAAWAQCLADRGVTIDRPARSAHPEYPSVIYPMDYGFIPGTVGTDDEPVDVFVGTGATGLAGLLLTRDYRQEDREAKLLYNCTPVEIYTAHGFVNYDRSLLEGVLVPRRPMLTLWSNSGPAASDSQVLHGDAVPTENR